MLLVMFKGVMYIDTHTHTTLRDMVVEWTKTVLEYDADWSVFVKTSQADTLWGPSTCLILFPDI